jgi:hypothetical protein
LIEDKWETDILGKTVDGRWERFKALYIKELQKLTDDGIDSTAMNVQQVLIARIDDFESKYESDVQTLSNDQLTLETVFQASEVPSVCICICVCLCLCVSGHAVYSAVCVFVSVSLPSRESEREGERLCVYSISPRCTRELSRTCRRPTINFCLRFFVSIFVCL